LRGQGIAPQYIGASSARKTCGITVSRGEKGKDVVMRFLLDKEPSFVVEYTTYGNIKKHFYDIADAIVIAKAGFLCRPEEKIEILKNFLRLSHISRDEFLFYCPYCEHHKPKMSVNLGKNAYKCWVCDTKGNNIWRLVRKFGAPSDKRKWGALENRVDVAESIYEKIFGTPEEGLVENVELPKEFVSLTSKELLVGGKKAKKYLLNRGMTERDIARWKVGYCDSGEYEGRVIFPSFNYAGKLNYFVGRSHSGDWMKYKNPTVSRDVIFNELNIDWKEKVCLVEGIFDAVKAGINSIPLLGSTLNEKSVLFQ